MPKVREIMTPSPKTCMVDHSIVCALDIMKNENCGAVPIVDQQGQVCGIVTDRDIALSLADHVSRRPEEILVRDCLGSGMQVVTVSPEDDVQQAIQLMEQHQIRRIVVVDDQQRCVGIVAQADIALKEQNPAEAGELVREVSKSR